MRQGTQEALVDQGLYSPSGERNALVLSSPQYGQAYPANGGWVVWLAWNSDRAM